MEHGRCSVSCPTQRSPPLVGAGLLQFRVLVLLPYPHVTLQEFQLDQVDQEPSTENGSMLDENE